IYLLGGFRVVVGARVIDETAWRLRRARHLVSLLALAPDQRRHAEQLMERLWPDLAPAAARNNLKYALHVARRLLDPDAAGPRSWLQRRDEHIALHASGRAWTDVAAFEAAAAAAQAD